MYPKLRLVYAMQSILTRKMITGVLMYVHFSAMHSTTLHASVLYAGPIDLHPNEPSSDMANQTP